MNFNNLLHTLYSLWKSLLVTGRQLYKSIKQPTSKEIYRPLAHQIGIVTLPYPHTSLSVPERGRYQLNNVIEDCIMCDQCARACPVDCIEIEGVPALEVFGTTSNGFKKRIHAAKFNIDMAKCCFCGLCTTVCPTACLTMTSKYDFSVFDIANHQFSFATMTEQEIIEKKEAWALHERQKE